MANQDEANAPQSTDPKKRILVVMEDCKALAQPIAQYWKEELGKRGYETVAMETIVDGFAHLSGDKNKYDLVILDPLNAAIMSRSPLRDAVKANVLGILGRAKRGGAQTICTIEELLTEELYDMNALKPFIDRKVQHANFLELIGAVQEMLSTPVRQV